MPVRLPEKRYAMRCFTSLVAVVLCLATIHAGGQASAPATVPSVAEIDRIITRVLDSSAAYLQTFRNLTAEETKELEQFDKSGRANKRRRIVADLLVYQAARGADPVEYRDVREVDGMPVKQRSERALTILQRAMSAASLERELQVIGRESQRYDFNYHVGGLTINQGSLGPKFRSEYRVDWVGRDQLDGHDVVVLDYRLTTPMPLSSPFLAGLDKGLFPSFGANAADIRTRIWVDATTFQLRRDRWQIVALNPALPDPLIFLNRESTYGESRFGILTPQRILYDFHGRTGGTKQKPSITLTARMTFTYGAFRRFAVATDETIATPGAR